MPGGRETLYRPRTKGRLEWRHIPRNGREHAGACGSIWGCARARHEDVHQLKCPLGTGPSQACMRDGDHRRGVCRQRTALHRSLALAPPASWSVVCLELCDLNQSLASSVVPSVTNRADHFQHSASRVHSSHLGLNISAHQASQWLPTRRNCSC